MASEKINLDYDILKKQAEIFKAISHKTRLAILHILFKENKCVKDIVEELGNLERTGISKHLNVLRNHGLIDYKEEGTSRIYFLKARCLLTAMECTLNIVK